MGKAPSRELSTAAELKKGDIIKIRRNNSSSASFHYAVYAGDNLVIHVSVITEPEIEVCQCSEETRYAPGNVTPQCDQCSRYYKSAVRFDTLDRVCNKDPFSVDNGLDFKHRPLSPNQIVDSAKKLRGPIRYNLFSYNSEHFACWCRYGIALSTQTKFKWVNEEEYLKIVKIYTPVDFRGSNSAAKSTLFSDHQITNLTEGDDNGSKITSRQKLLAETRCDRSSTVEGRYYNIKTRGPEFKSLATAGCQGISRNSCFKGVRSMAEVKPELQTPGNLVKILGSSCGTVGFFHWALIVKVNEVIHVSVLTGDESCKCPDYVTFVPSNKAPYCGICGKHYQYVVRKDAFDVLIKGRQFEIDNHLDSKCSPLSAGEIVSRAKALLGPVKYHALQFNCEHFVNWCRYDKPVCVQSMRQWFNTKDYLKNVKQGVQVSWNWINVVGQRVSRSYISRERSGEELPKYHDLLLDTNHIPQVTY